MSTLILQSRVWCKCYPVSLLTCLQLQPVFNQNLLKLWCHRTAWEPLVSFVIYNVLCNWEELVNIMITRLNVVENYFYVYGVINLIFSLIHRTDFFCIPANWLVIQSEYFHVSSYWRSREMLTNYSVFKLLLRSENFFVLQISMQFHCRVQFQLDISN